MSQALHQAELRALQTGIVFLYLKLKDFYHFKEWMTDLKKLALYPFLSDSREFVKKLNISIEDLLTDVVYEKARVFGIERVVNAFKKRDVGDRKLVNESDFVSEILSYPIAKMISTCIRDSFMIRRYALGEARHAYRHLLNESLDFVLFVCKDLNLDVKEEDGKLRIHFIDYLRYAPTNYKKWKLVNREMSKGFVRLDKKDLVRVIQEVVMKTIVDDLSTKSCIDLAEDIFRKEIDEIREELNRQKKRLSTHPVGRVSVVDLPPCMKEILKMIQSGENVPHMGRFSFVAFMHALGASREEIFKLFSTAPDFDEERTRYQIDHITGKISSTEYVPPSCDKMRTYGLCPADKIDDICKSVKHPLSYYWKKVKKK